MRAKYDIIGKEYNTTRCADVFIANRLFDLIAPHRNGIYLDIGCGTGNYTNALYKKGLDFIGIDPSYEMLRKAQKLNSEIDWRQGHVENTGLDLESVCGIVASLTIHHWVELNTAFTELYRILKPDGKIVIFTASPEQMKSYWLNAYFPKMLEDSIKQMPSMESVFKAMENSGFSDIKKTSYEVTNELKDLFLYSGKHQPSLYLKPEVRNGISSFSSLANQKEVAEGLSRLQEDINTDKIKEVMNSYTSDLGDYLFISALKKSNNS
ncbi:class I SAM-dependent methyltransferase [Flavobacteriaceae bacterium M23B6Z8]